MREVVKIDSISSDGTLSVLKYKVMTVDGVELEVPNTRWRKALTPLDKGNIDDIVPPLLAQLIDSFWTDEVIDNFINSIAEHDTNA